MRNLRNSIPGFRTKKSWKTIIALVGYPIILFLFWVILLTEFEYSVTSSDRLFKFIENLFFSIIIIVIPFVLLTNFFGIRDKIPFFSKKDKKSKFIGTILSIVLLTI